MLRYLAQPTLPVGKNHPREPATRQARSMVAGLGELVSLCRHAPGDRAGQLCAEFVTLSQVPLLYAGGSGEHIVQLCQGMRALFRSMATSRFVNEPLNAFLHKPSYPFIGMATAQANRSGNVGNPHPIS